jgi:hypothetical protein
VLASVAGRDYRDAWYRDVALGRGGGKRDMGMVSARLVKGLGKVEGVE